MALSEVLTELQAELMCPVCLDYLNDPITIDCDHSFCKSCISTVWKHSRVRFPCPVCRQPSQKCFLHVNTQLASLVNQTKFLHSYTTTRLEQQTKQWCEEHNQILILYCEEDQELVCPLCAQSPAHEGHHVRSVAKAAASHQLLCVSLENQLSKELKLTIAEKSNFLQVRKKVSEQRRYLASEFERLSQAVEHEHEATLGRITEDSRLQKQFRANLAAYSDHISALEGLLREVAERSLMPDRMMLREVKSLQQRSESMTPPTVQHLDYRNNVGFSLPPLCSTLNTIIQKFQESISLDPQTAHIYLRVSKDKKSVRCVAQRPWTGAALLSVLGQESFTSGRHYWEVQVGDKPVWAVGVCIEAPDYKAPLSEARWLLAESRRFWTVELKDGDYLAVSSVVVPLAVKYKPTGIGVYLDYKLGQVSFYDSRTRSHLFSFTEPFTEPLKPYIRVGPDKAPLSVGTERA